MVERFADQVRLPHDGKLVIARLGRAIVRVRQLLAIGRQQEELYLDTGLDTQSLGGGFLHQTIEDIARRVSNRRVLHDAIRRNPGGVWLPGQLDNAVRIGHPQHVRMRRRQIQPGGEAGKAGTVLLCLAD